MKVRFILTLFVFSLLTAISSSEAHAISGPSKQGMHQVHATATTAEGGQALSKKAVRKANRLNKKIQKQFDNSKPNRGDRSFIVAIVLSIFFGLLGVDRFYLGYIFLGILKLITLGGFGVWYLIDIILIAANSLRPKHGEYYDH